MTKVASPLSGTLTPARLVNVRNCWGLTSDICEAMQPSSRLDGVSRQVGTAVPALLPSSTSSIAWYVLAGTRAALNSCGTV